MSDAILSDIQRRLNNLVRSGVIAEVQPSPLRVKVKIGDLVTDWLRPQMPAAGPVSVSYFPSAGEAVQVISESGDLRNGVVHLGLHNASNEPPTTEPGVYKIRFSDGTFVSYDINDTVLVIELMGGETSLTASLEGWVFKGRVTFENAVTAKETIDAEGNIGTKSELSDSKGTMASVRGIFNTHDHDETDSVTLPPNQQM
ncbi:phage baseplate assembly protein V [Buttiauxella ferragutiae ATCC 51602]|uniref:Phage baseplate assembly protein V n=1 Tax=Buttiauxella ferragutiae ATCC 51602 TaxID=1354252 RepID=A0ABX2W774_9ENTR|nr:phage baseplate assembly protein V [Buttiauxella ferragutiae]OAT26724.1 phage baseplate assembly protein V [Buttiauxella ferragutiae ATCC 51602]